MTVTSLQVRSPTRRWMGRYTLAAARTCTCPALPWDARPARALTRRLRATMSGVSLWQFLRPLSAPLRTSVRTSGSSPRPDAECRAELPEYIWAFTLAPCCRARRTCGQERRPWAAPVQGRGGRGPVQTQQAALD